MTQSVKMAADSDTPTFPTDLGSAHPHLLATLHDRVVGLLVGSALGDAIGLYTEFLSAASATAYYPSRRFTLSPTPTPFHQDMHRLKHELGDWTDDTDHALLILLASLHGSSSSSTSRGAVLHLPDPKDFAARLKTWVEQGLRALDTLPLGLGNLVGTVVRSPGYVDDPAATARRVWVERGRRLAPNGSLMRTHPLGALCLTAPEPAAFAAAARLSRATHVDPRCVLACVVGTGLLRGLLRGEVAAEADIDALVRRAVDWFRVEREEGGGGGGSGDGDDDREKLDEAELDRHVTAASLAALKLDDVQSIGYVYKALGSGVLLLRMAMRRAAASDGALLAETGVFEELITDLIMCGGDADTNACFAGALLGAFLGYRALPGHWKHGLRHEAWLMGKAEALCRVLQVANGDYDGQADPDTRPDGGRGFLNMGEMEERFHKRQSEIMLSMFLAKQQEAKAMKKKARWSFLGRPGQ